MAESEKPAQPQTAAEVIERFRAEYRKAECTEQEVNLAVIQAQVVGELPWGDEP